MEKNKEYHTRRSASSADTRSGLTATGGVISDYADGPTVYRAHVFTSSGALNVTELGDFPAEADYVIVGGGVLVDLIEVVGVVPVPLFQEL